MDNDTKIKSDQLNENLPVRQTKPFKLKDKVGRQGVRLNLKQVFGFIPEEIIVSKVYGQSNCFVVNAVLTLAELEKEKALFEKEKHSRILTKESELN